MTLARPSASLKRSRQYIHFHMNTYVLSSICCSPVRSLYSLAASIVVRILNDKFCLTHFELNIPQRVLSYIVSQLKVIYD
jgi:hypothetical protein